METPVSRHNVPSTSSNPLDFGFHESRLPGLQQSICVGSRKSNIFSNVRLMIHTDPLVWPHRLGMAGLDTSHLISCASALIHRIHQPVGFSILQQTVVNGFPNKESLVGLFIPRPCPGHPSHLHLWLVERQVQQSFRWRDRKIGSFVRWCSFF